MDISKWKSVAIRHDTWKVIRALGIKDERKPVEVVALLVRKDIERRADLKGMSPEKYIERLFSQVEKHKSFNKTVNGKQKK
jgi:hypothetical protein